MSTNTPDIEPKNIDKRIVERLMRIGLFDEKALDKSLKTLPDVAENAMPVDSVLAVMDEDLNEGAE